MQIAKVVGSVVSTIKHHNLTGVSLLLVQLIENGIPAKIMVAADSTRQAGVGDYVTLIGSKEAALMFRKDLTPSDLTITGFIDDHAAHIEN